MREYLKSRARLKELPLRRRGKRIDEVMERCDLTRAQDRIIGKLSKGFRQRVGIADAILANPEVIIMDEPTIGLDPHQVIMIRDLIASLRGKMSVIISSHILPEIEMTCDRVVILHEGRLLASGALNDLMAKANATVTAEMQAPLPEVQQWAAELALGQAEIAGQPDGYVRCQFAGPIDGSARERIFAAANERGWTLRELSRKAPSLEDLFVSLTQEKEEPQ